jgi:hypothetical protein
MALRIRPASVDEPGSMYRSVRRLMGHSLWAQGAALALPAPFAMVARHAKTQMRTGGPDDDDEDDELRRLMPILALVITIAVVFGS